MGTDAALTLELETPEALHQIGDAEGPGMLHQGISLLMTPVPGGGFLLFTAYSSDGPIQLFRNGELVQTFGGRGQGPGEYERVTGLGVDPRTGDVWVEDGMRMVSFQPDGESGPVVDRSYAGSFSSGFLVLNDGSLLVAGPGATPENLGFLLHRYDPQNGRWSSHHPVFRDSLFSPVQDARRWWRRLALRPDGRIVAVSHGYVIEILDPEQGFEVETTVIRRPESWPQDILEDLQARRRGDHPLAPPFAVSDAWVDLDDRLWVVASVPKDDWRQDLEGDPQRPGELTLASPDFGMAALVEAIDLSDWKVLASYRLDVYVRGIVGPGKVAHYVGDLPYPQIEVVHVPINQEGVP